MNLFFGGGSLSSLMKPHFWAKVGPKALLRNTLKQNILCKYFPNAWLFTQTIFGFDIFCLIIEK